MSEREPTAVRNDELFDEHAESYKADVNRSIAFTGLNVDFFTRVKADYILDICSEHFRGIDAISALDVGCGVGANHDILGAKFKSLCGVDVSPKSIGLARARHPSVQYKIYDGVALPYEDSSFDLAFAICVMHHVPTKDWSTLCDEFFRVVKPGGLMLIFEHNPRNPLTLRAVNSCEFDADAVLLDGKQTIALLDAAGFHDVTARYILSVPAANSMLRKIDRIFSRLPLGAQYYARAVR